MQLNGAIGIVYLILFVSSMLKTLGDSLEEARVKFRKQAELEAKGR
jgi:hypothetical protein